METEAHSYLVMYWSNNLRARNAANIESIRQLDAEKRHLKDMTKRLRVTKKTSQDDSIDLLSTCDRMKTITKVKLVYLIHRDSLLTNPTVLSITFDDRSIIVTVQYFVDDHNSIPCTIEGIPIILQMADNIEYEPKYKFTLQQFIDYQYHLETIEDYRADLMLIPRVVEIVPLLSSIELQIAREDDYQPCQFDDIPITYRICERSENSSTPIRKRRR